VRRYRQLMTNSRTPMLPGAAIEETGMQLVLGVSHAPVPRGRSHGGAKFWGFSSIYMRTPFNAERTTFGKVTHVG